MKEAELKRLEERLENWSQWFNESGGGSTQGTCASAERGYVAPRVDEEAVANSYVSTLDVSDAQEIHEALLHMPWQPERQFLYAWYAHKYKAGVIARQLGFKGQADVELFRRRNLERLSIELVRLEKSRVVLIRRGAPIWSGIAKVDSSAYKASIAVASSGLTERRDQPDGWSGAPKVREDDQTEPA